MQQLMTKSGRSKSAFLCDQAELKNACIIGVTETWLSECVLDSEIMHDLPGYSIFRSDRKKRQGGGVALFLRDDLSGEVLSTFSNGVCESIIVKIHQLNHIFR